MKKLISLCSLVAMLAWCIVPASAFDRPGYATVNPQTYNEGESAPVSIDRTTGAQRVQMHERATYSASLTAKTATAAGTAPWFTLCGNNTKIIRLQQFEASITVATAAVYADVVLKKTSTQASGGTPVVLFQTSWDSTNANSAAAVVNFYSALPTAGSLVGTIASRQVFAPITGTPAVDVIPATFNWMDRIQSQAPILRNSNQCIEASFGTTTTNAPTISMYVVWTEE